MSKIIVEQDEVFEYNVDVGYEENFEKWLRWNNRERRIYGEKERTVEEGKKIFRSIYGGVWWVDTNLIIKIILLQI